MLAETNSNQVDPEKKEEIKKLEEKREYLKEWLRRVEKANDVVPQVQLNLELTDWEIEALTNAPDEADEIPSVDLPARIRQDCSYWVDTLPMIPSYDSGLISAASAVSTAGTQSVYEYIGRVGDLGTPDALTYSNRYTALYHQLQASQDRPQSVRGFIEILCTPQTLQRFDDALSAYLSAKAGTGKRETAALAMRNLLDGIQGDLFELARIRPKENMTWEEMAKRLAKNGPTGVESRGIIGQKQNRISLIGRLSDILKDREAGSLTNIENVWTQVIDHIYTVLGLVEPPNSREQINWV